MSNFSDKDSMPHSEPIFEIIKEANKKVLNESKRSPKFMPEPTPAPRVTDAELEQYSSLFDFDAASIFDADWVGQVAEDFDQFNAIGSNPDLNASPVTINEQNPIVTSSASANEPSSEQNAADTPPADIQSLEGFEWSQEQQDDFLNNLNGIGSEGTNSWCADAVASEENFDGHSKQNIEEQIPIFTDKDQAILDSFGPAVADEISAKYPVQDVSNTADSQSSQDLTAQDTVLQGSEQLEDTSNTDRLEDPTSTAVKLEDKVTTQDQLNLLTESTEKESSASILNFDQYDKFLFPVQSILPSRMNHDENTTRNHQGSTSQPPTNIWESAPVMSVQQPGLCQNEVGAAQNRLEHNLSGGRENYDEYSRARELQNENDRTHTPLPHQYLDTPYGKFNAVQAPQPYPCLQPSGNFNLRAGFEMQRAGNMPSSVENGVYDTSNMVSQSTGNDQRSKANQGPKKRPAWETRPDAIRPRVRMTEEEFQWLRPNEGPRGVFENQRKKAAGERLKDEAETDALEKAGMPRPRSKKQKPFKGGVHIEVWEKERLNNRRRAQGKSGRELFLEKPKLRGKRKGREISEAEPQTESKKLKLEESSRFEPQSTTRGINEGFTHNAYVSSMPAVDRFNLGTSNDPYSNESFMTSSMNQGTISSAPIHNSYIQNYSNHYGNNYGNSYGDGYGSSYGNNNYLGNHNTDPFLENGMTNSGMPRYGTLRSMPASGAASTSIGQGIRPEFGGAHQARAVYRHDQHLRSFHSKSEQNARASYDRSNVPPLPNAEPVQQFGNLQPQPSQRLSASIYEARTSGHQDVMNPANQTLTNVGMRSIANSLIDPKLQSQAQFSMPSVMGAQTGERAIHNYEYDEEFEDFGTQKRREH